MNFRELETLLKVRRILPSSDDLRRKPWRGSSRPTAGHCYVASEVVYHALGGKEAGYTVEGRVWEESQHWWLRSPSGKVLDPTWDQFDTPLQFADYAAGKRRSFLTNHPSKRAVQMAARAGIDLPERKEE